MKTRTLAVADVETSLLADKETPKTKFWGLAIDGEDYRRFNTTESLSLFLRQRSHTPLLVYNHHDFDVVQLIVDRAPVRIREVRTGRVLRAILGEHEWRNSYAIYPTALAKILAACGYEKAGLDDLDTRNYQDTVNAMGAFKQLSERWRGVFGNSPLGSAQLTAAGLAFASSENFAGELPVYLRNRDSYRGGRVEAFRVGQCGKASQFDINSSYPFAICDAPSRDKLHYVEVSIDTDGPCPFFYLTEQRDKLLFPRGKFRTCVWESNYERYIRPHSGVRSISIVNTVECDLSWLNRLAPLIRHAYAQRQLAKDCGDMATEYAVKIGLNSIYGRLGMKDERDIAVYSDKVATGDRVHYYQTDTGYLSFKSVKVTPKANYLYASYITDNARARLYSAMRALGSPFYCDTDSIYCSDSEAKALPQGKELGQWKYEGREELSVISSKDYTWGKSEKRKGGGRNYVWTLKRALAGLPVSEVVKNRISAYDKRDVLPDGSTLPLTVVDW